MQVKDFDRIQVLVLRLILRAYVEYRICTCAAKSSSAAKVIPGPHTLLRTYVTGNNA